MLCATMAEQYHLLPSQVAEQATIFDMMASDIKSSWDEYRRATPEERAKIKLKKMKVEDVKTIMENMRK